MKGIFPSFGQEINLVAQVLQVSVNRRGRDEEDFGFDAALDNILHQAFVTALAYYIPVFITLSPGVIAEIMRFVNDYQIIISPVNRCEIDIGCPATVTTQVGVG
ncbi:MAG: hypothetical protein DDT27_01650 [Dehalococcoidia bacterium]|nr:hypothetical protein [Chloroflexota bacterium]